MQRCRWSTSLAEASPTRQARRWPRAAPACMLAFPLDRALLLMSTRAPERAVAASTARLHPPPRCTPPPPTHTHTHALHPAPPAPPGGAGRACGTHRDEQSGGRGKGWASEASTLAAPALSLHTCSAARPLVQVASRVWWANQTIIHSFIHSFLRSFVHSFVRSFVPSITQVVSHVRKGQHIGVGPNVTVTWARRLITTDKLLKLREQEALLALLAQLPPGQP